MDKDKYVILVNSCDAYEELWTPFFKVLKDNWKNLNCEIILNTETKKFNMEGMNIRTFELGAERKGYQWGGRLRATLREVKSEYVISLFDDFILETKVDIRRLQQCLDWMEKDKKIAAFYLMTLPQPNQPDDKYEGFDLVPQGQNYRLNSAPAIWRKEKLMEYTGDIDTPWAWEFFGSTRTYHTGDTFYCVKKGNDPIYNYNHRMGGAIHRGKWVRSVIEPVIEKYELQLNLSKRGFEDEVTLGKRHSLKWKLQFFYLGYKMVGKNMFVMLYRMVKVKIRWT